MFLPSEGFAAHMYVKSDDNPIMQRNDQEIMFLSK